MAVCKTIRTKEGIVDFLIQSENGDECISAFKYSDGKAEVHSLRVDCTPLNLDENTAVNLLSHDQFPSLLVAVTPKQNQSLEIRIWDASGNQGFIQKDIQPKLDSKKDGKPRYTFPIKHFTKEVLTEFTTSSYKDMINLTINGTISIMVHFRLLESGCFYIETKDSYIFAEPSHIKQTIFLKGQDKLYIAAMETNNINLLALENDKLSLSHSIHMAGTSLKRLHRVTLSKCLVIDNMGQISLFSIPNELISLKFPSSMNGHGICSAVGFKHTNEGILAICNNESTINFYYLADILCSVTNKKSVFVKPYRAFCSQFPINALNFLKSNQLAMVSTVNQSITLLGGLSNGSI